MQNEDGVDRERSTLAELHDEAPTPFAARASIEGTEPLARRPHGVSPPLAASSPEPPSGATFLATDKLPSLKFPRHRPRYAPGCFGRLHLYDPEADDCASCTFAQDCDKAASENRRLLGEWNELIFRDRDDIAIEYSERYGRRAVEDPSMAVKPLGVSSSEAFRKGKGVLALIRRWHQGKHERRIEHERSDARRRKKEGPLTPPDPVRLVNTEAAQRERLLRRHIDMRLPSRILEQLDERHAEITLWWRAARLAEIRVGGPAPDAKVAEEFERLGGGRANRHQARSRRLLIQRLERPGEPWFTLAKPRM